MNDEGEYCPETKFVIFLWLRFFFAVLLWVWGAQRYHRQTIVIYILSLI